MLGFLHFFGRLNVNDLAAEETIPSQYQIIFRMLPVFIRVIPVVCSLLIAVGVFCVCGALIYWLFQWFVKPVKRAWSPSMNSVGEAVGCLVIFLSAQILVASLLALLLTLGGPVVQIFQMALFSCLGGEIIVRLGITLCLAALTVGLLGRLGRLRSGRVRGRFAFWDLSAGSKDLFFTLGWILPVVFVVYVPIHFAGALFWRLAFILLGEQATLQDVVLAPFQQGTFAIVAVWLLSATVVPVYEEILFRGALYRALRDQMGLVPALLISSFIFALVHYNATALLPIMVLAILLACVYEWSGTLWAPIMLHVAFNFINFGFLA